MTFRSLAYFTRGMVLFVTFLILIIFIYNTILLIILKRNKIGTIVSLVATAIAYVLFQMLEMHHYGDYYIGSELPLPALMTLQIALYLLAVLQQSAIIKWQKGHISNMSVKEAFDKLPAGLCYYLTNGIPIMVNEKMQEISHDIFGKAVMDADELWDNFSKEESQRIIRGGDAPIVLCSDGSVYSIRRNRLSIKGKDLFEIVAADVSREYELTKELEMRRAKAVTLNSRLKALLATIEYVTMNRELLQLKAALHDNIGQSILIARRYLSSPGSVDREEMLSFWKNNIKHLLSDEVEEWELPYYVISKEADKLGIKLQIVGELPAESRLIPVVDAAISVHVGNTLKHADGKVATISVKKTAGSYILNFSNDGKQPSGPIEEKGGLKNLRNDVENAGGSMKICTSPEFGMEIILPREET